MMADAYDSGFANAIRSAAHGAPDSLAAMLRSNLPLNGGERELLALLVSGELSKPAGRPSFGPGAPHIAAAVLYYRTQKGLHGEASAAKETAHREGKSESTIREWDRLTREREVEIAKHTNFPKK